MKSRQSAQILPDAVVFEIFVQCLEFGFLAHVQKLCVCRFLSGHLCRTFLDPVEGDENRQAMMKGQRM